MASVTGFGNLAEDLRDFADSIESIVDDLDDSMESAYYDTAKEVRREASQRVAEDTGELRRSIEAKRSTSGNRAEVVAGAPHAALVEYGNGPGYIYPTTAKYMHFTYKGQEQFRKRVNSYGPMPYMRPALRKSKPYLNRSAAHHLNALYRKHLR